MMEVVQLASLYGGLTLVHVLFFDSFNWEHMALGSSIERTENKFFT